MSVYIPLSGKLGTGLFAMVDEADAPEIQAYRWYLDEDGYARRSTRGPNRRHVRMHRQIMGLTWGDPRQVDHLNRSGLDNRRSNLRICSLAENNQNQPSRSGGSSAYRGVYWSRKNQGWIASVTVNRRRRYLGTFESEIQAAKAASDARRELLPFSIEPPIGVFA